MKHLFVLTLLSVLLLSSCGISDSIENSADIDSALITSSAAEKAEVTASSVADTETSSQVAASTQEPFSETVTNITTASAKSTTIDHETNLTTKAVPSISSYTDKSSYKNNDTIKFSIISNSDIESCIEPYFCTLEYYDNDKWVEIPRLTEGFSPGEVGIIINNETSPYTQDVNLSDYGKLREGTYRIGQKYSYDGISQNPSMTYSEFQIIS